MLACLLVWRIARPDARLPARLAYRHPAARLPARLAYRHPAARLPARPAAFLFSI